MEMMERAQKRVCGKKSADSTYEEIKWAFSTTFDSLASQIVVSQPEKEAKECAPFAWSSSLSSLLLLLLWPCLEWLVLEELLEHGQGLSCTWRKKKAGKRRE